MSALASSVINKSSKKIVPKAAIQRRRPAASPSTSSAPQANVEAPSQETPPASVSNAHDTRSTAITPSVAPGDESEQQEVRQPSQSLLERGPDIVRQSPSNGENHAVEPIVDSGSHLPKRHASTAPQAVSTPVPEKLIESRPRPSRRRGISSNADGETTNLTSADPPLEPPIKRRRIARGKAHSSETGATQPSSHVLDLRTSPTTNNLNVRTTRAAAKSQVQQAAKGSPNKTSTDKPSSKTAASKPSRSKRSGPSPEKPRKRGRKRDLTPDNAEMVEIAPSIIKMADLCKDRRTGKKSQRERDLEALDWTDVIHKQQERKSQRERGEIPPRETVDQMLERMEKQHQPVSSKPAVPKMRLVDGKMVLDDQSLRVDRHANAAAETETLEEIEENELTRRVNSGSWMKREKKEPWDDEMTNLFYLGLRMFGTDFMIISRMFPGRTRRQIKLKFTREERSNPQRIRDTLLGPKEPMDLAVYSRYTNTEYGDPAVFQQELDDNAAKHAEEQKREEEVRQEAQRQKRAEIMDSAAAAHSDHQQVDGDTTTRDTRTQATSTKGTSAPSKRGSKVQARGRKTKSRPKAGEKMQILGTIEDG
ncbi:MAG: Transcription factor TFIIIB component B [Piccolia ochrophora]|nr:MAG: Transcription factor TFIIIB component B [Piccolia ochrophora]